MISSSPLADLMPARHWENAAALATRAFLWPLQVLIAAPAVLFPAALTAMLLRHAEVQVFAFDRLAFVLLVVAVVLRAAAARQRLFYIERATWPMVGLTLMAVANVIGQPYDRETWSLLASKFIVPFVLFHLAGMFFAEENSLCQFEKLALVVLTYLSLIAIAFLCGAHALIFPRFILDESIGFHTDRARGPFLQAVANGVSLNMLGLLALHAYRRGTLRGAKAMALLGSVAVAILATMTRAVWLSFSATVLALLFLSKKGVARRLSIAAALIAVLGLMVAMNSNDLSGALGSRLEDRGPIDYREAVLGGGWEMFLERPWLGWGFHQMPSELPRHVSGYRGDFLYPHNTFLELMAEQGMLGFALYVWLMWEMWRLGRGAIPANEKNGFLNEHFHRIWPILLGVYWVNAAVVVMNYQFVNGVLFTMAGMLAAQRRRAQELQPC